ncbi:hypothetical protein BGZ60DRAFT_523325 [Tricladium varicosporioides]|nr:hypothetical protein BGZ60DRAFT_523325 [Hymenoscyphus varicosporioides]
MDTNHVLTQWKNFAVQFARDNITPTPVTSSDDLDIGNVYYNLQVIGTSGINERSLRILNDCTELEHYIGNKLMKFEVYLVSLATGQDVIPVKIAAGRRVAIRSEIQMETARIMVRHGICKGANPHILSRTNPLVLECVRNKVPANKAEVAFIADSQHTSTTLFTIAVRSGCVARIHRDR